MRRALALAALASAIVTGAERVQPGKNAYQLRGRQQDVYYYPAHQSQALGSVLFAPGDGGWRGFAVTIGEQMAGWGYNVYGIDTKRYLESFTEAGRTLSESDVRTDFGTLATWIAPDGRVNLVGWSEGAGLGLLGAAADKKAFQGLVAIGLGEASVLGWRTVDNLTYITKKEPNEPHFPSLPWVGKIAPAPFAMIHSQGDEYTPVPAARKLFAAAGEPKRWWLIPARNHRFDGAREQFFAALREALDWVGRGGK